MTAVEGGYSGREQDYIPLRVDYKDAGETPVFSRGDIEAARTEMANGLLVGNPGTQEFRVGRSLQLKASQGDVLTPTEQAFLDGIKPLRAQYDILREQYKAEEMSPADYEQANDRITSQFHTLYIQYEQKVEEENRKKYDVTKQD